MSEMSVAMDVLADPPLPTYLSRISVRVCTSMLAPSKVRHYLRLTGIGVWAREGTQLSMSEERSLYNAADLREF